MSRYVLVTPARNEELHIERTITCVLSQTLRPSKWVIVDDGSTDHTVEIVSKYASRYGFIILLKLRRDGRRNFANKATAFNAGVKSIASAGYSFIGNLDADTTVAPDYYANITAEFDKDATLGIAGGIVYTSVGSRFVTADNALDSVGGAVQLFRKECFDQIGGYVPLRCGGIDAAAEITARMNGWKVRKFPENKVFEHRRTGSVDAQLLASLYREGVRFHSLGYSTLFYICRSLYKLTDRPPVVGSSVALLGFMIARFTRSPVLLPAKAVSYLRSEQMSKLKYWLFGKATTARKVFDASSH